MASMSRGKAAKASKVVKPKKSTRRSTPSSRNHRFQTFSERIAKLKIDPVRRRRGLEGQDEVSDNTSTYFGTALEEWKETNLSETFTAFAKEVTPLCDNLPMVLHNEDKIMNVLIAYVEPKDGLALEALLNLLAHFAHDLDARFEKHFQRSVATILQVAAKHPDPAVIEWSFTCLAWLYKYLSRLLTPDLRPLYDLIVPYLGKADNKPFIVRFAAESFSFLLRKAATAYDRNSMPLDNVMTHMLRDVSAFGGRTSDLYRQGQMTLLTESIKGVQRGLHSSGVAVFRSILKCCSEPGQVNVMTEILSGTLTSMIHHTEPETFKPLLEVILAYATQANEVRQPSQLIAENTLLFTAISVRKGARILEWKPVVQAVTSMVDAVNSVSVPIEDKNIAAILSTVAVTMQTAPIAAVSNSILLLDVMRNGKWEPFFLHFCDLFSRLGEDRWSLLSSSFEKFVVHQWQQSEEGIYRLVMKLPTVQGDGNNFPCPLEMQNTILSTFERLADKNYLEDEEIQLLALCNAQLAALPHFKVDASIAAAIQRCLVQIIKVALKEGDPRSDRFRVFAMGTALSQATRMDFEVSTDADLWPILSAASKQYTTAVHFWKGLHQYLESVPDVRIENFEVETLTDSLLQGLASPSHEIREYSLEIIQLLYRKRQQEVPELLSIALLIETTPLTLDTSRSISLNIRRLATSYRLSTDGLMQKAIPTYCFGLLHVKLAQAWTDAMEAMSTMCETAVGEDIITSLVQAWLEGSAVSEQPENLDPKELDANSDNFKVFSDFQCSNMAKVAAICKQAFSQSGNCREVLMQQFERSHQRICAITPESRSQALRVLAKIPSVAEKRSRLLVPVLLRWAGNASDEEGHDSNDQRWSRKHQKAMLGVFAQFVNPEVLYKSAEVYNAFLGLLANGDVEIQRSALSAILAWKQSAITRYEEHLTNLLDDSRFREEISVFLQQGDDDEAIRDEDKAEFMPVLLRLLYGKAIAGGKNGQQARRKAIFVGLARFGDMALRQFTEIAIAMPLEGPLFQDGQLVWSVVDGYDVLPRKQLGMLNMLHDMLDTLGSALDSVAPMVADAILLCLIRASRQLETVDDNVEASATHASLLRSVRQTAFRCLVHVFRIFDKDDFSQHARVITKELVEPRLSKLPAENAYSVSGMMRLFSTWTLSQKTAPFLVEYCPPLLDRLAACLVEPAAKDEVKLFIIEDILESLLRVEPSLIQSHAGNFVQRLTEVLRRDPSPDILNAALRSTPSLAAQVSSSPEARQLIDLCTSLLRKPAKTVGYGAKTDLLKTVLQLVDRCAVEHIQSLYEAVSVLFARFRDHRDLLCDVLSKLAELRIDLKDVANICSGLNTLHNLDAPGFDSRYKAFGMIDDFSKTDSNQTAAVIYNCLFFIRDDEDIATRTSASLGLRRLIDQASRRQDLEMMSAAILPGLKRGMQEPSELVRSEYLQVTAHLIQRCPEWHPIKDMIPLLAEGDEEASFFNNILHIQQHRRLRALQRLSSAASQLSSTNIADVFVPLIEHFIFDQAEGDAALNLANEAIKTLGALVPSMTWSSYRSTLRRYISYIKSKPDLEKLVLRLLGSVIDGLHQCASKQSAMETVPNGTPSNSVDINITGTEASQSRLAASLPDQQKLSAELCRDFLPSLTDYLHLKDDSTVDRRVPVAIPIIKLLRLLGPAEFAARLPAVLTDISHVLRSRSQEARDQTRKTLVQISALVGPQYFGFILKELRSALQRGYQLHVLSFTVHSLLVQEANVFRPGDLDYCLSDMTATVMDDIFGATGQEKDAEEYKSAMKEVKSSKSYDTMEHLAKVTSVNKLGLLIHPIRTLLMEKIDAKIVKKIDALLARVKNGLKDNSAVGGQETLVFCYEIIRQVHTQQKKTGSSMHVDDYKTRKYLYQMKASNKGNKGATTSYSFKLVSFSLNLLQTVLRKHEALQTPKNLSGFLPVIGDAMVGDQEEVKLAAVRLLALVLRVPLEELDNNAALYVKESVAMIRAAPSTNTESAQAALRLVTAVLREKRETDPRETDIAFMLKALKTDLDEPDRRGAIFPFLKAVVGRKIVITEVYETLDKVRSNMITNPDRDVRDSSRSVYLQFLMSYPQGKNRWTQQASYLVQNMTYEHKSGRLSVLEAISSLLTKVGDDVVQQLAPMFFGRLVIMLVNDEEALCREMAGALIAKILERADEERTSGFITLMQGWLKNPASPDLQRVALQCWTMYLQVREPELRILNYLQEQLYDMLLSGTGSSEAEDWQLVYYALSTFSKVSEVSPRTAFAKKSAKLWENIQECLFYPHAWVKLSASKLLSLFFADVARHSATKDDGLANLPLYGSGGLALSGDDMRRLCAAAIKMLRVPSISETLAAQSASILVFLSRCFAANGITWKGLSATTNTADPTAEDLEASDSDDDTEEGHSQTALEHVFERLAAVVRREASSVTARLAALHFLEALLKTLTTDAIPVASIRAVLAPIFTLTDKSIPQSETSAPLVDKAREVQDLVEKKLGTQAYIDAMSVVQAAARGKREERRQKRRIDAVAAPEKWAKEKQRKYEGKKLKRKEKGAEARGRRRGW